MNSKFRFISLYCLFSCDMVFHLFLSIRDLEFPSWNRLIAYQWKGYGGEP